MNFIFREEDRRAIDLLLDRTAVVAGKTTGVSAYAATDGHLRQSVARVEKVLSLLDHMTANNPPRHLIDQTLRFVKDGSGRDVTIHRNLAPAAFSSQRPVA
ncbi:MAG TPA: hypothetical protein VFC46_15420 [Humisphaera sp.]|nr:hypothetical protein [Humisphaera sp.]